MPKTVPTVRQVVRWIAKLGGFLGRTHDGEPGVTVVWRGWHRLHDFTTMWLVMHGTPVVERPGRVAREKCFLTTRRGLAQEICQPSVSRAGL